MSQAELSQSLCDMIKREVKLVYQGKQASTLIKYLEDYQLQPTLPQIPQQMIILLGGAYILGKRYPTLCIFVQRHAQKLKHHAQPLYDIGNAGRDQNLKKLLLQIKNYMVQCKHEFKDLFEIATKQFILETIAKYFTSFALTKLKSDYEINQKFIEDRGYQIKDGYILFNTEVQDQRVNQMLQERMKQIVSITQKVVSLQK